MYELMIIVFVIGYACITIEHQLKVDKAAIALITGILCWTIYVFGKEEIVQLDKVKNYAEEEFSNIYPAVPRKVHIVLSESGVIYIILVQVNKIYIYFEYMYSNF